MQSSVNEVFGIAELLEHILLQLGSIQDITRAQRVCRRWRNFIQDSPALQRARWYRPHGEHEDPANTPAWRLKSLNPVFTSLGISIGRNHLSPTDLREHGDFDLTKRVYDKPGSWTTMLATQPPCRFMRVECYSDYSADDTMDYLIESTTGCLLAGDVMAVLAECQNRQEMGVDRWAGVRHYEGRFFPASETDEVVVEYRPILQHMADDVSLKVVVGQAWGSGDFPAFSLRRVRPPAEHAPHDPAGDMGFLHELVVHRMVWGGYEYRWDRERHGGLRPEWRVCKTGEYKANLLAVRTYEGEYLAECSHIFRLLSDV